MILWTILTIMITAAAVILAAPFLRRLGLDQPQRAGGAIEPRDAEPKGARSSLGKRGFVAIAGTGVIALGLAGLYALNGGPDVPLPPGSLVSTPAGTSPVDQLAAATLTSSGGGWPQHPSEPRLGSVDEMIARLAERLNRSPNDPEGWRMLGWSYFNTGRFAQAASAYAKAIELNPINADFRSSRGEAVVRAADGLVTEEAKSEFEQALRLDAKDPRARFFIGLAKAQAGNRVAALNDWIAILNETDSNEAWAGDLRQRVSELGRETGVDVEKQLHLQRLARAGGLPAQAAAPDTRDIPSSAGAIVAASKSGLSADDVRDVAAMPPADRLAMIREMVDRLAARLSQSPGDVDGWIKLMRSHQVLGETDAAQRTLRRALDALKDAPQERDRISAAARQLGLIK